jgi:hypothetical protein
MFQAGDKVWVEDSAQIDVSFVAWTYIDAHRYATITVKCDMLPADKGSAGDVVYCLEWPDEFDGGWDCHNACAKRRGQQIAGKHLSLDFEASRQVTTVPTCEDYINRYDHDETQSR